PWETPFRSLSPGIKKILFSGETYQGKNTWKGFNRIVANLYHKTGSHDFRSELGKLLSPSACPQCSGGRLNPEMLAVKIRQKNIADLHHLTVARAYDFFKKLKSDLPARFAELSREILEEILFRLDYMMRIGLDYIELDRRASDLSGGEAQRIRLSTQIGNKLKDVIYVLDEPTIGLHERDTSRLLDVLSDFRDRGNTVIMVEHDGNAIKKADYIIDLGPGAGEQGGNISYAGKFISPDQAQKKSLITRAGFWPYISRKSSRNIYRERLPGSAGSLLLPGVNIHNIENIDFEIPLGRLVGISGVSGSGKSSLIMDYLAPAAEKYLEQKKSAKLVCLENGKPSKTPPFLALGLIDQSPVTASRRSTVVSYMECFDMIRRIFAASRSGREAGFSPGRFSFNSSAGQCPLCRGLGFREIQMHFISDLNLECESCHGKKYSREVLQIYYRGKNIFDCLELTVNEALSFFNGHERIIKKLFFLQQTGLGYVRLGMHTGNLSGGELQRLKIAYELSQGSRGVRSLYLMDEPTTGLHFSDVECLIGALDALVKKGDSVIVIEHNPEFLSNCDYLIDLGPEGGAGGGKIVVCGTPDEVKKSGKGFTAEFLN
ncbi:MAG TPA: excinuclease ABC subunit UvrA, partial [Spirochaetia bacterium]|nr:excinuclease ABC subunit UvrA [Spirochaetia bacterium]